MQFSIITTACNANVEVNYNTNVLQDRLL